MSWTIAKLGELTKILSGTTPDSANTAYWNGHHIWVTPTDLGKLDSWTVVDSARRVSSAGLASCNLQLVPLNAVVMSSRAPIGHLAMAGVNLHTNQGCKSFVCGDRLNPEFLFFTLKFRMPEIQALGSGSTFAEVSKSALEDFEIAFPSLEEQSGIAALLKSQLTAVKSARQAAQAQSNEIRLLKTQALKAVFAAIKETCLIGDVARIQSGYAFKSETFKKQGVGLLRNANMAPGRVYWDDAVYLSPDAAPAHAAYALAAGDVLISLDRPIISTGIKVARIAASDLPALLVQRVGRFRIDETRLNADYLYAFLHTEPFIEAISGHEQSLGVPHVSPGQIEAIEIPLPSIEEQQRLAVILNNIAQATREAQTAAELQLRDIELLPSRLLAQAFDTQKENQDDK